MKGIIIPPVGSYCEVIPKYGYKFYMTIVDLNVKNDSFGTIKYQVHKTVMSDNNTIKHANNFSVTEKNWFNESLTGRKVNVV